MKNDINSLLKGIIPEPTTLDLPEEVPSSEEVYSMTKMVVMAILSKPELSAADAPLIEALAKLSETYYSDSYQSDFQMEVC